MTNISYEKILIPLITSFEFFNVKSKIIITLLK